MTGRVLVVTLLLFGWAGVMGSAWRGEELRPDAQLTRIPLSLGPWAGRDLPAFDQRVLEVLGADEYISRVYTRDDATAVGLYIGYYRSQRQGDTMHSPLNCLPGAGWQPVSSGRISVPIEGREPMIVNRYVVEKGDERQVVLYWYQSQGRVVASEYWSKAYLVWDSLRTNRSDAAMVRVMSAVRPTDPSEDAAAQRALDFVAQMHPLLAERLPS